MWSSGAPEELLGPLNDVERVNAPTVLYWAGDRHLIRSMPRVSVVGSRHPSPEGIRRAVRLAKHLAGNGVAVVSGLARGIDTYAHQTAIDAGGRTVAVLGTPLDDCFPPENCALQAMIAQHHLLVSQFPPGCPTRRENFPQRNRTMALISDATVIIEAGNRSGTLHQGWEALRLNRPLFILKSVMEDKALAWPREMLKYGAIELAAPEAIYEYLPSTSADLRAEAAF